VGTRHQVLVEGLSTRDEKRAVDPGPDGMAQLTGRTMCDRIVVFDAPTRLIGRLVDIDILAAGAWSLSGVVADGLADAVPLAELEMGGPPPLHEISLPVNRPAATASGPSRG
jgi:tRNA-2-methylthio-N6-dimethylallyladenosine synthase